MTEKLIPNVAREFRLHKSIKQKWSMPDILPNNMISSPGLMNTCASYW